LRHRPPQLRKTASHEGYEALLAHLDHRIAHAESASIRRRLRVRTR
jgi:hypothetical protein